LSATQAPVIEPVPDLVEVLVPVGGRVLVVSGLKLTADPDPQAFGPQELTQAIESWTGPGLLIFNGDTLELLACSSADPRAALAAHPKLIANVAAFAAAPGRRVLYIPGARDSRAAWDPQVGAAVREALGAELALAVELQVTTGAGTRRVRVEPGHRLDPLSCPGDPHNPAESPLGQHLVSDVLPALHGTQSRSTGHDGWLAGLDALDDPALFPRFLASRLIYRRLGRHAWWLLLPFLGAIILRLPLAVIRHAHAQLPSASRMLVFVGLATIVDLLLVGIVAALVVRQTWKALAGVALSRPGERTDPNEPARALARDLISVDHTGLITGHTCRPELVHFGPGFYANTGCGAEVVSEAPARLPGLGMPSVFLAHRQVAWVELEAGNELHARLLYARQDVPGATWIERLLASRSPSADDAQPSPGLAKLAREGTLRPAIVATFPQGGSWPTPVDPARRLRRIRRFSAGLVAFAAVLSLVSTFVEPVRERLQFVLQLFPVAVPEAANALVAVASIGLLLLALSIRRGQRRAFVIAVALLVGAAVLHLIKGGDLEEAVVALGVALYLLAHRDAFGAATDRVSTNRSLWTLGIGAVVAVAGGTLGIELGTRISRSRHHHRLPLAKAILASAERLVGWQSIALPDRLDDFLTAAMVAVAGGVVVAAAWLFLRPVVTRRGVTARAHGHPAALADLRRAREILARHGSGTLDYFALRSDKQFFYWGDSLVAYGVYGGVCLVSPDPVGPSTEREEAWKAFHRFADDKGWTLAVLGAGEDWLPIYRASGMHDLYVGDEGVVACQNFSLEGGRHKGLRQAVNRIAKYGYTIGFHDPTTAPPELRSQLECVMTKSRRGDVERGFSMTLGRVFHPDDEGLLLAVVHGPEQMGPVAFCQYVPAPGIDGYSLDLMRRDDGEHPNGLLDFAIVETIRHLAAEGRRGLGLNFATMRAVLTGEAGEGVSQRVQAWLLRRMSDSMQIESLWRFNAKYDPDWQPRYALYDSPEHALAAAFAVARAESFWELPVIGRFLVPSADRASSDVGTPELEPVGDRRSR
jgi:lysylphosphatidylglycerol synthetase-like protein (DUF2156 family)